MVFYDFVSGLDMATQSVRLVVGLYNNIAQYGEPTVLPTVYCEGAASSYFQQGANMGIIGAKQPVPRSESFMTASYFLVFYICEINMKKYHSIHLVASKTKYTNNCFFQVPTPAGPGSGDRAAICRCARATVHPCLGKGVLV